MTAIPMLYQNDGQRLPQIGLGVYGADSTETARAVHDAIALGYRGFDTAAFYGNEVGVGRGLRSSESDRNALHVTTKLLNTEHGYDQTLRAFDLSLHALQLDYVDLYLIHWPLPGIDRYVQAWRALVRLKDEGRATSIGVSNFEPEYIARLVGETGEMPAVNQIELHPGFSNRRVRDSNAERGILTQAWSPLGRGRVFGNDILRGIAAKHGRSVAQIVLRWHVEQGHAVIPKTLNPIRMAENISIYDFALDEDDRRNITTVKGTVRTGADPKTYNG